MSASPATVRHPLYGRRAEKARRLAELVAAGLSVRDAAREVGVARNTAYVYLRDPSGAAQRAKAKKGTCEVCGGPTSAPKNQRCGTCARTGPPHYWTKEKIVEAIRRWVVTYGDIPGTNDWSPRSETVEQLARYRRLRSGGGLPPFPSTTTVYGVFGSFNAAVEAAGYTPRPPGGNTRPRPTRCVNGHPYDEANTYVYPDGHYSCRACRRVSQRKYKPLKGRRPKERCPRGHQMTPENTIVHPKTGWRRCRECANARKAARRFGLLVG